MTRAFFSSILLPVAFAICCTSAFPAPPRPNILVILADDMGYSDAGCFGGEIATPNLDALAANGLRFTQFYNTARCWPTRASLMTGYYAQAVRRDQLPGVKSGGGGTRPRWARLLPEHLKPLGYRAYHSGKWHIDGPRLAGGFDHSYCLIDQDRFFSPRTHFEDDVQLPPVKPGSGYYATTAIATHAIRQLQAHAARYPGRPFFQYLAFTSPHFPLQARSEDIAKYRQRYRLGWEVIRQQRWQRLTNTGIVNWPLPALDPDIIPSWNWSETKLRQQIGPGEVGHAVPWAQLTPAQQEFQARKMAIHAAMVDRMDQEIGRVLAQLKSMGAWENTVIFFLSDNGASAEQIIRGDRHDPTAPPGSARTYLCLGPGWSSAANTPLRLHKSWVHEGGISTPLIVHWPAGLKDAGALRRNPGHVIDLVPTILDLAGGQWPDTIAGQPVPPLPGKSLVPAFTRDGAVRHDYLWWYHSGNRALRMGNWKLVAAGARGPWELYDLSHDRGEMHNLADQYPSRVSAMEQAWTKHLQHFKQLATSDGQGRLRKQIRRNAR